MLNVSEKQKHIGELAQQNPTLRFDRLYRTLCDQRWLTEAWRRIRNNAGSRTAGIDGMTRDDVDDTLIRRLAAKLKQQEYEPHPVRRVHIPKANGKTRPLGIATLRDRIVQSALKMLLEPIWEGDFLDCSHGFRPRRSCHTALNRVAKRFPRSTWIIEGDIRGCYDNIDHQKLMIILNKRINDQKLLRLIGKFLKAGYLERWEYHKTYSGTPQGSIVSPLLMNIFLHELDKFTEHTLGANVPESAADIRARRNPAYRRLEGRCHYIQQQLNGTIRLKRTRLTAKRRRELQQTLKQLKQERARIPMLLTRKKVGYVRYADDFLLILQGMTKAEAHVIKENVRKFMKQELALELSEEKTLISHPTKRIRFLGYQLQSRGGKRKTLKLDIPRDAQRELLAKVSRLTRLHQIDEADLILKLNPLLRGWMEYYKYASAPQRTFSRLLSKVWWKVSHYLARKHKTTIPKVLRKHAVTVTKNGRTRKTLRKEIHGKAIDLWMFPPPSGDIFTLSTHDPRVDQQPLLTHEWAKGRSTEQRMEALIKAGYRCQVCGTTKRLEVHHVGGLKVKHERNLVRAGHAKQRRVLCKQCHVRHGHGGRLR
jgi:group II intron reverse transcriptase/maturase